MKTLYQDAQTAKILDFPQQQPRHVSEMTDDEIRKRVDREAYMEKRYGVTGLLCYKLRHNISIFDGKKRQL